MPLRIRPSKVWGWAQRLRGARRLTPTALHRAPRARVGYEITRGIQDLVDAVLEELAESAELRVGSEGRDPLVELAAHLRPPSGNAPNAEFAIRDTFDVEAR